MESVVCVDANGNEMHLHTYYQCQMNAQKRSEKSVWGICSDLAEYIGGVDDLQFMQGNQVVCQAQPIIAALQNAGGSLTFVYKKGTYTLPFEFHINDVDKLPATLRVPQCSVTYQVVAQALCRESTGAMKAVVAGLFGNHGVVMAKEDLVVNRYPDMGDQAVTAKPVVRVGVLGALDDNQTVPRFCVQIGKDTVAPNDTLQLSLRVYVPEPNSPAEQASDNVAPFAQTAASSSGTSTGEPIQQQPPYVGNSVCAYKVKCKLVQKVRYMTDHVLVSDDNEPHMFWTKRVVLKQLVSDDLDLNTRDPIKVEWEMRIPDVQCSLDLDEVQVRYDVFVDFYPLRNQPQGLTRRLSFRGIAGDRARKKSVGCVLPLNVVPANAGALVEGPSVPQDNVNGTGAA
ncbi:hypothetical protein FB645_005096 [Coemansia sp. IMI 203386]|nr:hypothetical protein FB645_005096 [Coemansia sp. IMI 203386]